MNDTASLIMNYAWRAALATFQELFLVLGPPLLLALVMQLVSGISRRQASAALGEKAFLYITAPGVAVHELGHAFMCLLFGHRVDRVRLFQPTEDSLGCVEHSYNKRNPYHLIGNFFIGTAPIWGGALVISLAAWLLLGPDALVRVSSLPTGPSGLYSLDGTVRFLETFAGGVWDLLANAPYARWIEDWRFYVFAYLAFAVGCHVTLSPSDISGGFWGFVALVVVLYVVNLATLWAGPMLVEGAQALSSLSGTFVSILLGVLILNLLIAVPFSLLALLRRRVTG